MPAATPHRPVVWFAVIAVTAALFTFTIPQLPTLLPQERAVEAQESFPVSIGTVEGPEGWTLDIRAAATGSPIFSHDGVSIAVFDGIWFGNSAGLVENLAATLRERGAEVTPPEVADDATGESRELYELQYSQGDKAGLMVVVRQEVTVMVLRATGDAQALAGAADVIARMAETLDTGVITENAPPSDPGVRQGAAPTRIDQTWISRVAIALQGGGSES